MSEIEALQKELVGRLDSVYEKVSILQRSIDPEQMLTTEEAAKLCGNISQREVLRWVQLGLRRYEIGKGFRFKRSDVLEFMERFAMQEPQLLRRVR